jgi:hypothetical protein
MTERNRTESKPTEQPTTEGGRPLRILTAAQIHKIDKMLAEIGPFGEVRLIKNKGKLSVIQTVESEDAIQPCTNSQCRAK